MCYRLRRVKTRNELDVDSSRQEGYCFLAKENCAYCVFNCSSYFSKWLSSNVFYNTGEVGPDLFKELVQFVF